MKTKQLDPVVYWRFLKDYGYEYGYTNRKYELLIEFITKPLELWMFTPCKLVNGEWVVLEEPSKPLSPDKDEEWDKWTILRNKYEEAKDKVLFERYDLELSLSSHDIIISTTQSRIGWSCGGDQYYGYGNGVTHSNITGRTYMVDNTTVTEITEGQGLTWCQRNASWADPNYPNDEFPIPTGGSGGDNNDVLQGTGNN